MENKLLAAASFSSQKFFISPEFSHMPSQIIDEIKIICVLMAEKLGCTFLMEFSHKGDITFKIISDGSFSDFDDIGADLEIKKLQREKKELLKSLKLWYLVNFTPEGENLKNTLIK